MTDEGERRGLTPPSETAPLPRGRLLGVDFGTVRIGLSVCDPDQRVASPLDTYTRRDAKSDATFFSRLGVAQNAVGWVVGLPYLASGDEGPKAKECRAFAAWLTATTGLPVAFHDERFTTVAAEESLWAAGLSHAERKKRRDRVAAQMILQAYLDAARAAGPQYQPSPSTE
ncbi:MAG: Holliday junction resolvase RuvX [Gemmataceae bacterium]